MNSNINLTAKFVEANTPPAFTSTPITTGNQGVLYTYSIIATDLDDDDTLTLTTPTKPVWIEFTDNEDGTGVLEGTPTNSDVGENNIELLVTDNHGGTDTQSFTITVTTGEESLFEMFVPLFIR